MSISKRSFAALATLCLAGCISGSASDTVSANEQVSLPSISALASQLGVSTSVLGSEGAVVLPDETFPLDVSSALSKLSNFGTLHLTIDKNQLSDDDLSSIREVKVALTPSDNSATSVVLSDYMLTPGDTVGTTINLPLNNPDTVLQYLENSKVNLTVGLTVDPSKLPMNGTTLQYSVELTASVDVNKSL